MDDFCGEGDDVADEGGVLEFDFSGAGDEAFFAVGFAHEAESEGVDFGHEVAAEEVALVVEVL